MGKRILKAVKTPIKSFYKSINILRGLYRYYVDKNSEFNFVVDERDTHHTILRDGTLISHSIYKITMLAGGDFQTPKHYKSENKEKDESGVSKVNLLNMKCYDKLDHYVTEDRFTDPLTIVELVSPKISGTKFFISNETPTKLKFAYKINYTNLSFFDTFTFYVSMTIPKEFNRKHKKEVLKIAPIYGVYRFVYKIDKQNSDCGSFVPKLTQKKNYKEKDIDSMYYSGISWDMLLPTKGRLDFKNITD
jgi:hypothetical protein